MTDIQLTAFAAALLSLIFSYIPGINASYDAQPPVIKRLVMLALLVVVTAAVSALACSPLASNFGITTKCDQAGIMSLISAFIAAIVANQGTWLITKK